jgi:hypothetical protein
MEIKGIDNASGFLHQRVPGYEDATFSGEGTEA